MKSSLSQSFAIHLFFLAVFGGIIFLSKKKEVETFNFEIVEKKAIAVAPKSPKIVINADKKVSEKKEMTKKVREVFGVKRKTLTDSSGTATAKIGNTLAKEEDDKVLRDDESDGLPAPAEEFLITSMPRPLEEVRPSYPMWAKEQKISGSVVFEILIDESGKVRRALLLKGLHPKLDQLAREAMLKFKFRPAYVEKKPAAAKIKYAIKYILES